MFSRFFIDRPIFASVVSIVITLAGAVSLGRLPLAQFPHVTPPTVQVDCTYPGASAQVVAEAVAAPIEQQVNGVENMLYMSSTCTNNGSYNLTVTFRQGVNLHLAQVLVQNRVNLALPALPEVIKRTGVSTRKRPPDNLMTVSINSPDRRFDQLYLSNYAMMHIREELARVPGVSDVYLQGQRDYSMRVWVDPDRLAARSLTASDVTQALREQNVQVATGQIGQPPTHAGQECQITLTTLGRLSYPEQFAEVILRVGNDGRLVRLKDVARVEMGARSQDTECRLDGKPSVGLSIYQLPDANALETADRVHAKMKELAQDFPDGMIYEIQFDTTPYTRECIQEVFKALEIAVLLVAFVVLLFLQNWRSAIIPLVAVPVAIFGTFGVMAVLSFSLNNLTLFGLVLVIGIVVDDAIVVVEAVEHHIEQGFAPREATIRAMVLVSGPVVAMGLVLSSVFLPCAFISGMTGQFFRQFALTIASATGISTFNSLTLSPALAAQLLRPRDQKNAHAPLPRLAFAAVGGWLSYAGFAPWLTRLMPLPDGWLLWIAPWAAAIGGALLGWCVGRPLNSGLRWGFRLFDCGFTRSTGLYLRGVGGLLRVTPLVLVGYGGLLLLTWWEFRHTPKGFIPAQDRGFLMVSLQLPDAASMERTRCVVKKMERITLNTPGVKHTLSTVGNSFMLSMPGSYVGSMFVILDDFIHRRAPTLTGEAIAARLRAAFAAQIPEAKVSVFPSPPIRGIGRTGGMRLMLEDRGDLGPSALQYYADNFVEKSGDEPRLVGADSVFRADAPQLFADVDRAQCMTMGVDIDEVFRTLQIYLGSLHANDFNRFGRTWQVVVQADARFRRQVETIRQLKVRNAQGQMVPIGAVANIRHTNGPTALTRYNMYPAAAITANAARGVSSGDGIAAMQEVAGRALPASMAYEWTDLAYQEIQAGNTAMMLFALAVVMVFLVLAAQYESWSLPLAVILVVPMCLLSAVSGVIVARMDINIFTQIGFVVLVGLASKNAILIVEYAKRQRAQGTCRREAALAACRLRLRPIVMTSAAFILGVSPLLFSQGAGAEMRRTLGTAMFSGMLGVTLFGIFLTPVFFVVIDRLSQTPFFTSPGMRWLRGLSLAVFALGFLRIGTRLVQRLARPVLRRISPSPPPQG